MEESMFYLNFRFVVLFSGGVDCTLLAVCLHNILPIDEPIELWNLSITSNDDLCDNEIYDRDTACIYIDDSSYICL